MNLHLDKDVRAVAEFIESNVVAARRVSVANCVVSIATALWGNHKPEAVMAIQLVSTPESDT